MKPTPSPAAAQGVPAAEDLPALRGRLVALVQRTLGDIPVVHDMPSAANTGAGCVCLYLLCFEAAKAAARQQRVLQFEARFLVTLHQPDTAAAGDALARLLFAALAEPALEVGLEPPPPALWSALGAAPQPSFTLCAPVRQIRAVRPAPPVRELLLRFGPAAASPAAASPAAPSLAEPTAAAPSSLPR